MGYHRKRCILSSYSIISPCCVSLDTLFPVLDWLCAEDSKVDLCGFRFDSSFGCCNWVYNALFCTYTIMHESVLASFLDLDSVNLPHGYNY